MAGREVREYTNLSDPKDKKWGKGKDKIDDEDITFQRMVAKMQEVAGERGGYLHGRGALDSDDLLYLKEQMEVEDDAERLLRRTEKRAFAAFKISLYSTLSDLHLHSFVLLLLFFFLYPFSVVISLMDAYKAANLADSTPPSVPLSLRVEPKPKSGIRQQDLLKNIVEIKPKRQRVSSTENPVSSAKPSTNGNGRASVQSIQMAKDSQSREVSSAQKSASKDSKHDTTRGTLSSNVKPSEAAVGAPVSVLGLAYGSSDEDD